MKKRMWWVIRKNIHEMEQLRNDIKENPLSRIKNSDGMVWGLASFLLGLHVLLSFMGRQMSIGTRHDDAQYLLLSQSLGSLGYRDVFLIGSPEHNIYPPGYPGMLFLWEALVGQSVGNLAVLNIIFSTLTLILMFITVWRLFSPSVALLSLAVLSVNPPMILSAGRIGSETPFMFLTLVTLSALSREPPSNRILALAGIAAVSASLTRMVGLTLVIAMGLYLVLQRRFRPLIIFGLSATASVGLWFLWVVMHPHAHIGRSYLTDATQILPTKSMDPLSLVIFLGEKLVNRLYLYLGVGVPDLFQLPTVGGTVIDNVVWVSLIGISLGFGLCEIYRRWPVAALYLLTYGTLMLVWSWGKLRFIEPLLPLLVPLALVGIGVIGRRITPQGGLAGMMVLAAVPLIIGTGVSFGLAREKASCNPEDKYQRVTCPEKHTAGFFEAVNYIEAEKFHDVVILSEKPATVFYYTKKKGVPRKEALMVDRNDFLGFLRNKHVSYVLLSQLHNSSVGFGSRLQPHCLNLEVEASFPPATYLFRILPEGEKAGNKMACQALAKHKKVFLNLIKKGVL